MNKLSLIAIAGSLLLAACAGREPTNAELTTLLHRADASVTDANAPLDAAAVICLRSWSGDSALTKGLAAAANMDAAKGACRSRLDGWLADATRNPSKLDFAQVSTPAATRRAMDLLAARGGSNDTGASANEAPPTVVAPAAAKPAEADPDAGPAPDIDAVLVEADTVCQKAKELIHSGSKDGRLQRYADFCSGNLTDSRNQVAQLKLNADAAGIEQLARKMDKMVSTGRALARNVENKAAGH